MASVSFEWCFFSSFFVAQRLTQIWKPIGWKKKKLGLHGRPVTKNSFKHFSCCSVAKFGEKVFNIAGTDVNLLVSLKCQSYWIYYRKQRAIKPLHRETRNNKGMEHIVAYLKIIIRLPLSPAGLCFWRACCHLPKATLWPKRLSRITAIKYQINDDLELRDIFRFVTAPPRRVFLRQYESLHLFCASFIHELL